MTDAATLAALLPHPLPESGTDRIALFAIRRMAATGLNDAHAAAVLLCFFGKSYRRPLVLIRALMAELARASHLQISVAPRCCPRMTRGEALLLKAIVGANADPHQSHARLTALTATDDCLGALTSAQAVEQAFRDLGRPLSRQ